MAELPRIAVTMGDPAGVGPEIVVKAALAPEVQEHCRTIIVGDCQRLASVAGSEDIVSLEIVQVGQLSEHLPFGHVDPECGDAAYQYVRRAVEFAVEGEVDAICTAPLNKESLNAAGHPFPGHTELLAHLAGVDEVSMVLSTPEFSVIHVTTHVGLLDAIERIEPELVHRTIVRGDGLLLDSHAARRRIGVCGINPHAGEHGLFGRGEEAEKIVPAVERARREGVDVEGPLPADTLFFRARRGDFDLVVAMYHDQGHGPIKVLGLDRGVNVTVGLPFIRTSVDHGTAFDIAGQGIADPGGMITAILTAARMAKRSESRPP